MPYVYRKKLELEEELLLYTTLLLCQIQLKTAVTIIRSSLFDKAVSSGDQHEDFHTVLADL